MFNSGGGILHGFSARIFYVFGPRGHIWDPGPNNVARAGPGAFFEQKWGPEKNVVLWKMYFPNGDYGGPPEGNGSYGAQEAFGQVISPQTHLKK